MNKEKLFSTCEECVLGALTCNILTPVIGSYDIVKKTISGAELDIQELSANNYANRSTGVSGYVDILIPQILASANKPTHVYIPRTPIYCDAVTVPVSLTRIGNTTTKHGFVSQHYNFVQPVIYPSTSAGIRTTRYHDETETTEIDEIAHFIMRANGRSSSGVVTDYLHTSAVSYASLAASSVAILRSHLNQVLLSDDELLTPISDGLCEGVLYMPSLDLFKVTFDYTAGGGITPKMNVYIRYSVIPLGQYTATDQSDPLLDEWGNRVSGTQRIALVPVHASAEWELPDAVSDTDMITKSVAVEYETRLKNIFSLSSGAGGEATVDPVYGFNKIYEDSDNSIYSCITETVVSGITYYQFMLGMKKEGQTRVAFPQNYSPVNIAETAAELTATSPYALTTAYPIIEIKRLKSDSRESSYNIKFGIESDDALINKLEYETGCGYFIVNVSASTAGDICPSYAMCGSIADYLITDTYLVRKDSVSSLCTMSQLGYIEDNSDGGTPYNPMVDTITSGDSVGSYLTIRDIGERRANMPIHSVSAVTNRYSGNSAYAHKIDSDTVQLWDGRSIPVFAPSVGTEGHGEALIYSATHHMHVSKYLVVFPLPVFYSYMQVSRELHIHADYWSGTQPRLAFTLIDGNRVQESFVAGDDNITVSPTAAVADSDDWRLSGYAWYLNYLKTAPEHHLYLHGLDFTHAFYATLGTPAVGRLKFCNFVESGIEYDWIAYYAVGCLNLYTTPAIGTGGVPVTASFTKNDLGIDFTNDGVVAAREASMFNNKKLLLSGDTLHLSTSAYSHTTDSANIYEPMRGVMIDDMYVLGNYMFVNTGNSTSIYAEFNQTVVRLGSVSGALCRYPAQERDKLYFATSSSDGVFVYQVMEGSIIPILESSGTKAVMSNDTLYGITVSILGNGTVNVYSLLGENIVLRGVLEDTAAWNVYDIKAETNGVLTSCMYVLESNGVHTAKRHQIEEEVSEYELESSEFIFPSIQSGGYLLSGVKLIFDVDNYKELKHTTFDFSVRINDDIEYAIKGASVAASKTLLFDVCPATYASYTISKCLVPLRGIRWLVQRIPEPIYSQLKCDTIIAIHSLPGYMFVSYNDLTVAYAMYGSEASKIATVKGLLQNHPVADQNGVYFAVKRGEYIIAHMLSRDGAVPVYQTYGESATMSCEFKSGVSMAVLEEGTVYVYSIDRGNVVYKGSSNLPFDITELVVAGCGDASQTLLRCDIDDNNSLYYKLTETPYDMDIDIESSEYHIAETQYGKPVLTGVRVEFDYINDKTFDIDIYVDDELYSTHTNIEVGRDVTIPIVPVIGEQLSYKIKNCSATVRGVKWLVYNLPLRIYNLLETELVEDIIVIGQYVFVSYNETTVVYATANGQAEIVATVVGKLMKFPAQEEGDVYFAVSKGGMIYAYHLSREGIIPVYELEGIKAVVSTEQGIGVILSILGEDIVTSYRLTKGNVIYLGKKESTPLSIITNIGTYREGDTVSVAVQTTDLLSQKTNNILNLDHALKPYEIESSDFVFPYREGRYMLFGLKIVFDKAPEIKKGHNSYDLSVYANDELYYVSTNHDVEAEVVIRFPAIPVGYARYKIGSCYQHIREVKWLAYRLPFINEMMFNKGQLIVDHGEEVNVLDEDAVKELYARIDSIAESILPITEDIQGISRRIDILHPAPQYSYTRYATDAEGAGFSILFDPAIHKYRGTYVTTEQLTPAQITVDLFIGLWQPYAPLYTYTRYASDDQGTDFSASYVVGTHTHRAVLTSTYLSPSDIVVGLFAGLWTPWAPDDTYDGGTW